MLLVAFKRCASIRSADVRASILITNVCADVRIATIFATSRNGVLACVCADGNAPLIQSACCYLYVIGAQMVAKSLNWSHKSSWVSTV